MDLSVSREYSVRAADLGADTLVIASSYSGNTEETIAALADARARGARVVILSAGGELAAIAARDGLPAVKLERPTPGFQPRAATGFFLGALAAILENAGLLPGGAAAMIAIGDGMRRHTDGVEDRALALAKALDGRIPVIYATAPFEPVALIAKIKFNENAKTPAFSYALPELNHNEMVGYTRLPGPFSAVVLDDPDAPSRAQHRVATTVATLETAGVPVIRVPLPAGEPPLVKAFAALYLFDFVTCAHAALGGIDPNPVAMVEDFKARLGPYVP
ncbi:MAG: SIS domain-containing protein [bacterium]